MLLLDSARARPPSAWVIPGSLWLTLASESSWGAIFTRRGALSTNSLVTLDVSLTSSWA